MTTRIGPEDWLMEMLDDVLNSQTNLSRNTLVSLELCYELYKNDKLKQRSK